jgi:hypothetical protein
MEEWRAYNVRRSQHASAIEGMCGYALLWSALRIALLDTVLFPLTIENGRS